MQDFFFYVKFIVVYWESVAKPRRLVDLAVHTKRRNKLEQIGTTWNKLERTGTGWNHLERAGAN